MTQGNSEALRSAIRHTSANTQHGLQDLISCRDPCMIAVPREGRDTWSVPHQLSKYPTWDEKECAFSNSGVEGFSYFS